MTLDELVCSLRGKKIAVVGIGVSNTPLIELLLRAGCSVTACDRSGRDKLGALADRLEGLGAVLRLGDGYLEGLDADVIFRTPGMRPDLPELKAAVERGAKLTSEMEAFFEVCPCPIIAVTGSDGKTTTTTIIAEILRAEGKTVHLGGNIGRPLLSEAGDMRPDDVAVLELSSFQLMTMKRSPSVAVVTNITPNHLDVHRDMEEYIEAKRNIVRYQGITDRAVLNFDNELARSFAATAPGEVLFFSRRGRIDDGVYVEGGVIFEAEGGRLRPLMEASRILLPGAHNVENYIAAFAATRGMASDSSRIKVAETFGGVSHRIELVRTINGVRYYNDSIASSPTRTIAGLHAFDGKVILIAGGKDKGVPFDSLGPEIVEHVKTLILTGMAAKKIRQAVEKTPGYAGSPEIIEEPDFEKAVLAAHRAAVPGDVVLLSPACTSFDRFRNFEERGNTFREIVERLEKCPT